MQKSDQQFVARLTLRKVDQAAFWLATFLLVAVSWAYLVDMAAMMGAMTSGAAMDHASMDHATMGHTAMNASGGGEWDMAYFWRMFVMWAIMMIAMMVPTAARTLMIFNRIAKMRSKCSFSTTYFFLIGYILAWSLFSLVATIFQWWLDQEQLLTSMLVLNSYSFGALMLIAAGIYQLSPLKQVCLRHCQSPTDFISRHFKRGYSGALAMGLQHGFFCLGCCWVLMLLLFVAGVMSLLWIMLITLFVLFEKLLPHLRPGWAMYSHWFTGIPLIVAGVFFFVLGLPVG